MKSIVRLNNLRIKSLLMLTLLAAVSGFSQKVAKTSHGEIFLIYPDGTWKNVTADSAAKPLHFSAISATHTKTDIIKHTYYTIGFDPKSKIPEWTYYHLTRQEVDSAVLDRKGDFVTDPKYNHDQAIDNDYAGSKYDKGHMVPCEDMSFNEQAMKETFYYSNCVPQTSKLNRGQWKNAEQLVRNWAVDNGSVDVFSGPVLEPGLQGLGKTGVLIPKYCYKIVLDYTEPVIKAIAFVMPNQDESLLDVKTYTCTIDHVEALTGIDFFPELPDAAEKELESHADVSLWNWDIHRKDIPASTETPQVTTPPQETNTTPVSVQCSAKTSKGERCKHMTTSPNGKCKQHGGN
ncbi:MAG: DNA/RNA non-specific endonuclease [Bacteroidetes bacterium]|nr:DNA/RNA non-specific endonuclease [Bacteroidota bacterium]